jgi:peptidoglycan/xylan/chitin deacetylase (PgdA/CDA1 family)
MLGWLSPTVFLGSAQRRLFAQGVPVFAYHKIGIPPRASADPFLYVSPTRFADQLAALRQNGYTPGSLAEPFPSQGNLAHSVVFTFDDGCSDVLEHGLAALELHRFTAIQFLVAGFLGRRNEWDVAKGDMPESLMDTAQIRDWLAAGHAIGSHSMTHRNLRQLRSAEAREEIQGSKKSLEDRFGLPIHHFSYPYGAWNESLRDQVGVAGYLTACTMLFGVNNSATPPFELRRIVPLSGAELLRKIRHRLARPFS